MSLVIIITSKIIGKTRFYSEFGQNGAYKMIPTYRAMMLKGCKKRSFKVTRDTYPNVFQNAPSIECPPNFPQTPYRGWIRTDNGRGPRIQLYEPGFADRYTLKGVGDRDRIAIQIHAGPGKSTGCFMVGGGKKGYRSFLAALETFTAPNEELAVHVHAR